MVIVPTAAVNTASGKSEHASIGSQVIWNTRKIVKSAIDTVLNKNTLLKVVEATIVLATLGAFYAYQNDLYSLISSSKETLDLSSTQDSTGSQNVDENPFTADTSSETSNETPSASANHSWILETNMSKWTDLSPWSEWTDLSKWNGERLLERIAWRFAGVAGIGKIFHSIYLCAQPTP